MANVHALDGEISVTVMHVESARYSIVVNDGAQLVRILLLQFRADRESYAVATSGALGKRFSQRRC